MVSDLTVVLRKPHAEQCRIRRSKAKRKIVRAGRRSGKTVGIAILALDAFLDGRRVLYAAPTSEQLETFWFEIKQALSEPLEAKVYTKDETRHVIEREGTQNMIRAKTAWNADTLRGDYADLLILDEYQMMNEDTWHVVGAPMLMDNDGDAVFIYTPPSLYSAGVSKARDPRHAAKMFKLAQGDTDGRWETFHFTSHDNPHISKRALADITRDMSQTAIRQEIMAEDSDESWKGLIYKTFRWDTQVIPRIHIPDSWPLYFGHDFGGAHPAALVYAQNPGTGDFWGIHEYLPGGGHSTAEHVKHFKEISEGRTVIKRQGGSHQEEEIREAYRQHGWEIREPNVTNVKAGIDKVTGLYDNNRVFYFDDMYMTLFELSNYAWKLDTDGGVTGEIADKAKYHLMDCARGILSGMRPETVVTGTTVAARSCSPF